MFIVFVMSNACVGYRSPLAKITRRWPSFGSLHNVSLWYEPIERGKPLPDAKKTFNFTRSEHVRALATFATKKPRAVLNSAFDVDIREVSAFFAERITAFVEQKKRDVALFTCVFRMHTPIKNIAVTVRLSRSKKQKMCGDITFHGYLKEPSPELVNLIMAVVIDDASSLWRKGLVLLGALCAWCKWGDRTTLLGGNKPASKQQLEVATHVAEVALPAVATRAAETQKTGVESADISTQTMHVRGAEVFTQTDGESSDGVGVGTVSGAGCGSWRRSVPEAETPEVGASASSEDGGEIMPEITSKALHSAMIGMYNDDLLLALRPQMTAVFDHFLFKGTPIKDYKLFKDEIEQFQQKTRILDDGSILFFCKSGTARVVIHKGSGRDHPDIKRLWAEWSSKQVESDVVVVVYCLEQKRNYADERELRWDSECYLNDIICKTGCSARSEGFAPCILVKYSPFTHAIPTRWCVSPAEDVARRSLTVFCSDDGLKAIAKMIRAAISNIAQARAVNAGVAAAKQSQEFKGVGVAVVEAFVQSWLPPSLWGPP